MSTIQSVEARVVSLELPEPTSFSSRSVTHRDYCLVRVTTVDGAQGIGFCYAGHTGGDIVALAVRDVLAPVVQGQDSHLVGGLWNRMYRETLLHGRAGAVMRAISAVDIALWDRNARAAGLPLWKYLGAVEGESVPAYASGGYYLDGKTPQDLAEEMRGYVELGFGAVKMKVGRLDVAGDDERIAAVRDAIGPQVLLMLDANNAWDSLPAALRAMDRWARHDLYWIEEPFSPDDITNHSRLAKSTPVLVATGEIEAGKWQHKALLDAEAAAFLQTDAAVCGGITEYRRIAGLADGYGIPMAPHWFHDLHVHLVAATPNARFVEFFPDSDVLNFRELIDRQLDFDGGRLLLPQDPGLGFDFDPDVVERSAVDGWS